MATHSKISPLASGAGGQPAGGGIHQQQQQQQRGATSSTPEAVVSAQLGARLGSQPEGLPFPRFAHLSQRFVRLLQVLGSSQLVEEPTSSSSRGELAAGSPTQQEPELQVSPVRPLLLYRRILMLSWILIWSLVTYPVLQERRLIAEVILRAAQEQGRGV